MDDRYMNKDKRPMAFNYGSVSPVKLSTEIFNTAPKSQIMHREAITNSTTPNTKTHKHNIDCNEISSTLN